MTVKTFTLLQKKTYFKEMLFFLIFYLSENPEKEISQVSSKTLCTTTVFFYIYIYKKYLFSIKSAY